MWLVLACLALGVVVGSTGLISNATIKWINKLSFICLLVMLSALGAKLGSAEGILERLGLLGTQAFALALTAVIGSIVPVYFLQKRLAMKKRARTDTPV